MADINDSKVDWDVIEKVEEYIGDKVQAVDDTVADIKTTASSIKDSVSDYGKEFGDNYVVWDEEETVPSEEFTGTLAPGEATYSTPRSIKGFNDPLEQTAIGLIKGGQISKDVINSIPSVSEVVTDPGRVLDLVEPFINTAIAAGEYATNAAIGAAGSVAESLTGEDYDGEIKFPRVKTKFGDYPERETEDWKILDEDNKKTNQLVKDFYATFKKRHNSAPYIASALELAPDLLTIAAGAIGNIPKYAGMMEGVLGGSRAEVEGSDVGEGKVLGTLGGYAGTKILNKFLNNLTPKEAEQIARINDGDPQAKEATLELLHYFNKNPSVGPSQLNKRLTGNPILDDILKRQRHKMSSDAYNSWIETIKKVGTKANISTTEIA